MGGNGLYHAAMLTNFINKDLNIVAVEFKSIPMYFNFFDHLNLFD